MEPAAEGGGTEKFITPETLLMLPQWSPPSDGGSTNPVLIGRIDLDDAAMEAVANRRRVAPYGLVKVLEGSLTCMRTLTGLGMTAPDNDCAVMHAVSYGGRGRGGG